MTRAELINDPKTDPDEDSEGYVDSGDGGYWSFAARRTKERVTVRFDRDVLAFYRRSGKGYQTRMNAALRAYMRTLDKTADQASRPGA